MAEDPDTDLQIEIRALRDEVHRLNSQKIVTRMNSMPRLLWMSFLRGLATGLGTVVGATALVSVFLYVLSQIEIIPIIGDWANQIAREIERIED